jgi:raffinose/stachyose/melibiose transport system permease protein
MMIERKRNIKDVFMIMILCVLTVIFLIPMFLVLMNSFKSRLFVSTQPFSFPNAQTFVGLENYINGLTTSGFFMAFLRSVWITVVSVVVIVIFTSMTAWYIIRVNSKFTKSLYYLFVFSMIVPFQMVMYTMTFVVNTIAFNNVFGIILVYLGFGAGLAVFMFTGFVKSIPVEVEEAATIDGCTPLQTFFMVV